MRINDYWLRMLARGGLLWAVNLVLGLILTLVFTIAIVLFSLIPIVGIILAILSVIIWILTSFIVNGWVATKTVKEWVRE